MKNTVCRCDVLFSRVFVFLCVFGAFFCFSYVRAENLAEGDKGFIEGEVIVKYKNLNQVSKTFPDGLSYTDFISKYALTQKGKIIKDIVLLEIKDDKTVEQKIAELKKDSNIEYAQPNFQYHPFDLGTNDTNKDLLWGLDNFAQTVNKITGTNDADIDIPEAWAINEGTNDSVVVAVIDNGVLYTHRDLIGSMWDGSNCKDENGNPYGSCVHGYDYAENDQLPLPILFDYHGTHVAGTIAAKKNNNEGIVGVAPRAKIMALRVTYTTDQIVKSINFAKHNGAKIINASWGCYSQDRGGIHPVCKKFYDFSDIAVEQAISSFPGLFIAAAGNGTGDIDAEGDNHDTDSFHMFPCDLSLENIICVAATDQSDGKANFSDYGVISVDVGAPGTNILSAALNDVSYQYLNGTSMATPHVAGLAALLWGYAPNLTKEEVKNLILTTGDSLSSLSGKTATGKRINAENAMKNIPLFAPFNLRIITTHSTAEITFKDNTFTEKNIHIARKIGKYGAWSQIASLPYSEGANLQIWTNKGLRSSTLYCYKIRAYDGLKYSPYSNEMCKKTAPVSISVSNITPEI